MTKNGIFIPGHDSKVLAATVKHIGLGIVGLRKFVELHTGKDVIVKI